MEKTKKNIGILSTPTLGGGLIFLVLAHNLQQNGYDVTFYSDSLVELQEWFPKITLKSLTKAGSLAEISKQHDALLAKANLASKYPDLNQYCIPIFFGRGYYKDGYWDKYQIKLPQDLEFLHKAGSVILSKLSRDLPLAEILAKFCKEVLKLKTVDKYNGLIAPQNLQHRKYAKRVIIHAVGSKSENCWPCKKFIKIAKKLQSQGLQPVFIMSKAEQCKLLPLLKDDFPVPEFATLDQLAAFIYESSYMLGNDSGIGHLASNLNIPTVTITAVGRKSGFRWRPGWGYGEVVRPRFKLKFLGQECWKSFITTRIVMRAFAKLINNYENKA